MTLEYEFQTIGVSGSQESKPKFIGFHHVTWYVSNARQVASYYITRFGFEKLAFQGLETGSRNISSIVVSNGEIRFVFKSALRNPSTILDEPEAKAAKEICDHVVRHGDGVKDVAFEVENIEALYTKAKENHGKIISPLSVVHDERGFVKQFVIQSYGDTTHTIVQLTNAHKRTFQGLFLPHYRDFPIIKELKDSINRALKPVTFSRIDHCVGNQFWGEMETTCQFYEKVLGFHRFWSVDDKQVFTKQSALKSIVMASPGNESIKMPINEPAKGAGKSQVEEFVEFYDGAGVQHIALLTNNIIETVGNLRKRGVEFIDVPATYYQDIRKRLIDNGILNEIDKTARDIDFNVIGSHHCINSVSDTKEHILVDSNENLNGNIQAADNPETTKKEGYNKNFSNNEFDYPNECCTEFSASPVIDKSKTPNCYCYTIHESIKEIEELNLLIDFDEHGYLLQIFTKPLTDRPTIFLEIIQRMNHDGFGVGNFRSLFEAIERDQILRGNI